MTNFLYVCTGAPTSVTMYDGSVTDLTGSPTETTNPSIVDADASFTHTCVAVHSNPQPVFTWTLGFTGTDTTEANAVDAKFVDKFSEITDTYTVADHCDMTLTCTSTHAETSNTEDSDTTVFKVRGT